MIVAADAFVVPKAVLHYHNHPSCFTIITPAATTTTTTMTSLRATSNNDDDDIELKDETRRGGGGFFRGVKNFFEELDAFVDDASARRLGAGAQY
jgi:hypothetical protein